MPEDNELSDQENKALELFRQLDADRQQEILDVMSCLLGLLEE